VIYLSKILPAFVLPAGIVLILLAAGLLLRRRALLIAAFALFWICSTPLVADALQGHLERGFTRSHATKAPAADAIVVLSTSRVVAPGPDAVSEWTDPDRFFGGVELFQAGRAPWLVFTGGWVPWEAQAPLEGDILARHAAALGVPGDRIITTGRVSNTAEEAAAVSEALAGRGLANARILLVTSAFHMPRARALFEEAGLRVTPFPVDFRTTDAGGFTLLDVLPTASGFARTEAAIRELYGRWFYAARARL
jgi:uncharacterized SAM-binding protein YcdF (DUF218 family)